MARVAALALVNLCLLKMPRGFGRALVVFALLVGNAHAAPHLAVFTTDEPISAGSNDAAVGLLVPGAGPETSRDRALAALIRGEVRNSLRGGSPEVGFAALNTSVASGCSAMCSKYERP